MGNNERMSAISLEAIDIEKPDDVNVIVGQSHFIKTVDDLHETLAGVSPQAKFGIAFCEASGVRLIRCSGNDDEMVSLATGAAAAVAAGHSFVIMLRDAYPVNVLNAIKMVPELCTIFCATANPVSILVARTERGRGVIGVIDGEPPLGVEQPSDVDARRALLRNLG